MKNLTKKPKKTNCEICGTKEKATLELHHIIPRTDPNCNNHGMNLACICASCHKLHHAGEITIIGVYPSTHPSGRTLIYERHGKSNVPGINEPYYTPKAPSMKIFTKDKDD